MENLKKLYKYLKNSNKKILFLTTSNRWEGQEELPKSSIIAKELSTSLQNGQIIETANGDELMIQIVGDEVFVNNAKVVAADLEAVNGVVHVIDSVLMP